MLAGCADVRQTVDEAGRRGGWRLRRLAAAEAGRLAAYAPPGARVGYSPAGAGSHSAGSTPGGTSPTIGGK